MKSSENLPDSDNLPIYNLKAVVQETGLKPDTLRAWERRYGVPEPERTASGHRLYSQNDINTLKWLNARLDEGLNISRAVALWQELNSRGQDPLKMADKQPIPPSHHEANQRTTEAPLAQPDTVRLSGNQIHELRGDWVAACLRFDEQGADQALNQAFSLFSPEIVCLQILQRGLSELGEGWNRGRVTVQQEHFASVLAMRRLQALIGATSLPTRAGIILVACVPEEEHAFPLMLLTVLLRRKGWRVIYLGANVPIQNLETTIEQTQPSLIILAAQQLHTAATLMEMSTTLTNRNLAVAYGGGVFVEQPAIQAAIPGYYLGHTFEGALEAIEQIMISPRPRQAAQKPDPAYIHALHRFGQRQAAIEAHVWNKLQHMDLPQATRNVATDLMEQALTASLNLGGPAHLQITLAWIENHLVNHHLVPHPEVELFMHTYLDTTEADLELPEEFVARWLHTQDEEKSS